MVRRQTNVWLQLAKWLLIPATLAAVGYLFLGPVVPYVLPGRAPITTPESTTSGEDKKTFGEPDVQVSVQPASNAYGRASSDRPRKKKRRKRTTPKPKVENTPVEAPVNDGPPPDDPPAETTGGGLVLSFPSY